ncbi:MAG: putative 2OG-Fe(II) oxygenase [Thioalkalispiraceae bacterium]|jgi:hypothetical protein
MSVLPANTISRKFNEKSAPLNQSLAQKILALSDAQIIRKTHYFAGRYENIYVDKDAIPELAEIIDQAHQYAAELLGRDVADLKIGFWINLMQKGHTTSLHCHEDADEQLSGVYYVKVPRGAGKFVYQLDGEPHSLEPEEGAFLFFSPSLLHEVTVHDSEQPRISIAFNIGLLQPEEED